MAFAETEKLKIYIVYGRQCAQDVTVQQINHIDTMAENAFVFAMNGTIMRVSEVGHMTMDIKNIQDYLLTELIQMEIIVPLTVDGQTR